MKPDACLLMFCPCMPAGGLRGVVYGGDDAKLQVFHTTRELLLQCTNKK